jgi:two-component system sensor histidine kinase HydH
MRTWMLGTWRTGAGLTRQFALLSFLAIGGITLALSVTLAVYLRTDLLTREWAITADFVRTAILSHLSASDLATPASAKAQQHFEAFYQQTAMMPEVVRVRIFDATEALVWADEPQLGGSRAGHDPHLTQALTGQTVVNLEPDTKARADRFPGNEFTRLVTVYVPIVFPGASRVAGVVELRKMPKQVFAGIRRGQLVVGGVGLLGGLVLYLSLFWIVRRAGRRIEEQHHALEQHSRDLAAANQDLQAVQAQLLEAERMAAIGEVVTAVAHGIRNPLANIRATAQVAWLECPEDDSSDGLRKSLATIMAEVDRLEGRLKELLQFVRPVARQEERVDLNAVLREALGMVAGRLAKANVRVTETLTPDLPPIRGSAMLLEQVLLSLLGNAIEAMSAAGGGLTVATGAVAGDDGRPLVFAEVQDTGPGIAPDEQPKIFAPFYTTKAQGTGLGLAIAKRFTEAQGGTIRVRSHVGEGAAFRVSFSTCTEG